MGNANRKWNLRRALLALFLSGLVFTAATTLSILGDPKGICSLALKIAALLSGAVFAYLGLEIFSRKKHVLIDERTEEILMRSACQCFFGLLASLLLGVLVLEYSPLAGTPLPHFVLAMIPFVSLLGYFIVFLCNDYWGV